MSILSQMQRLQQLAATGGSGLSRAELWPVTVTLSTDAADPKTGIECSGSPPSGSRQPAEMGVGFVKRTTRAFMLLRSQIPSGASIALGTVFTVTADVHNPANVGTTWSCSELNDSNAGGEIRAVCWRKDA